MRSLLPRQIGVLAELALPLMTALACARVNVASTLLAVAAIAYVLAHPPAVLALGYLGEEARRADGWRARRRLMAIAGFGFASLLGGYLIGGGRVHLAVLGPLGFGVLSGILTVRHEEKSYWGQVVTGVTLPGLAFPVAIAGGLRLDVAMQSWVAWVFTFLACTFAMRAIVDKTDPRQSRRRALVSLTGLVVVGGLGLVPGVTLGFVPALPTVLAAFAVAALQPRPRARDVVERIFVGAGVITAAALVWLTRG